VLLLFPPSFFFLSAFPWRTDDAPVRLAPFSGLRLRRASAFVRHSLARSLTRHVASCLPVSVI
jgi:hypothetical protein